MLVTLDEVLNSHTSLKDHFSMYQDTVQAAIQDPSKLSLDANKVKCLGKVLIEIEKDLLKGKIFQVGILYYLYHNSST